MRRRIVLAMCLLCVYSALLLGCEPPSDGEPVSVEFVPDCLPHAYFVDDESDFSQAYLLVTYSGGKTETIACEERWIDGFDTVTTGEKELFATYNNLKTSGYPYRVYMKNHPEREVVTSTRLEIYVGEREKYAEYLLALTSCDIESDIYGVCFTVRTEGLVLSDDLAEVAVEPDYFLLNVTCVRKSDDSFAVVMYSPKIGFANSLFASIRFEGKKPSAVSIVNVTVSDKTRDLYLPDAECAAEE